MKYGIITANTQLILGCAKLDKLEFSFENEMFLESLSMNIPVSNMVILRSIKFGLHQYVNGLDDAVFYYPLLEHTGGTQKNESRKIRMAVNSCTLGVIKLEYTGFCPPGMLMGYVFQFVASIEAKISNCD
jgi:hypothetical protein